jgi:UDP-glucose 4-epimerase
MKLDQERLLSALCRQHAHRALILRAPTVYGAHQDPAKHQGLISALIRSIHTSALVSIFVPRDSRRNYLWADDLARVAVKLPDKIPVAPGTSAVRIIATDRSRTIDEVVEAVSRIARRRPVVQFMAANHSAGHGFDLTQRSEYSEMQQLGPFTHLTEGIHRLLRQSLTANSPAQVSL